MRRIFNPLMICGAVLGYLIFGAIGEIQEAWWHSGAGVVWHEYSDSSEQVSEKQYKRIHYTNGWVFLGLGLYFWIVVATKYEPKDDVLPEK